MTEPPELAEAPELPQPSEAPGGAPAGPRRWLWPVLVAGWALLLLVLAMWSAVNDPPTVRDQTTITTAKQTIDTVVGQVRGLTPAAWQFTDQGYEESRCDLTVARDGVQATRLVTLSGPAGTEPQTLTALAEGLNGARVRQTDGTPDSFFQDAGYYVEVRGRTTGPGTIVVRLESGCRAA